MIDRTLYCTGSLNLKHVSFFFMFFVVGFRHDCHQLYRNFEYIFLFLKISLYLFTDQMNAYSTWNIDVSTWMIVSFKQKKILENAQKGFWFQLKLKIKMAFKRNRAQKNDQRSLHYFTWQLDRFSSRAF